MGKKINKAYWSVLKHINSGIGKINKFSDDLSQGVANMVFSSRSKVDSLRVDIEGKNGYKNYQLLIEKFERGELDKDSIVVQEMKDSTRTIVYTSRGPIIQIIYNTVDREEYSKLPIKQRRRIHQPVQSVSYEGMIDGYIDREYAKIRMLEYLEQSAKVDVSANKDFHYMDYKGFRKYGETYIEIQATYVNCGVDRDYELLENTFNGRVLELTSEQCHSI